MQKAILSFLLTLGICSTISAQVSSVKLLLEYNEVSTDYDVKLFIEDGSATTVMNRVQLNSRITVVVPTGSTIQLSEFFNPIQDNANYTGTQPMEWLMGEGTIAPPVQPDEDFYDFFPSLTTTSHYNNLNTGDTITLFSIDVDVEPCENSVRLFENGIDPPQSEMPNNEDYTIGFSIGSSIPLYNGNLYSIFSGGWTIELGDYEVCSGECVELVPDLICSTDDLDYLWSTGETTSTIFVCPDSDSTFTVEITDPNSQVLNLESTVSVTSLPDPAIVASNSPICAGEDIMLTASLVPDAIYSWMGPDGFSSNEQNPTIVAALASASGFYACFVEVDGCSSQVAIAEVAVDSLPLALIAGQDTLCSMETTSLTPAIGGTWISNNLETASVSNTGFVTPIAEGTATFTFTSSTTGCVSLPSDTVWIFEDPVVEFIGSNPICVGETTSVLPDSGGTWMSSDTAVARIDAVTGIITGVGQGDVAFTFTSSVSGCSATTVNLIVLSIPEVNVEDDELCASSTTALSPDDGGTWQALNPEVASLEDNIVTGLTSGQAGFLFTLGTTGCNSDTVWITILDQPITTLTGPDTICIAESTTIEPNSGGTWASSDATVVTVDNFGNVTGVGAGNATLTFTDASTLCTSDPSDTVFVLPVPEVELPVDKACIGETFNLSPQEGGIWKSTNAAVAVVDSTTGEVTTLSDGFVQFIFTPFNGNGCSASTPSLLVNPIPFEVAEPIASCVGLTGLIDGDFEGTWESSNTSIIDIDVNTGEFTAVSAGTATIIITDGGTGCTASLEIEVFDQTPVGFAGADTICEGDTTTVLPNMDGIWTSVNSSIAVVDIFGNVTGINPGNAELQFIDTNTGCASDILVVTVLANPTVTIEFLDPLCIGSTLSLSSASDGLWMSSDTAVAGVDSAGIATAVGEGVVSFTFSDGMCSVTSPVFEVLENLSIEIDTTICEGMDYNGLTESGTYTFDSVDVVTGCNIIITVDLEVLPLSDPLCTVGLEDIEALDIRMYPNPATERIFIESEAIVEGVRIFTMEYQLIEDIIPSSGSKTVEVSTKTLSAGLYLVLIKSNGKHTYKKLMIE
ncbi:MAG: Ig-like domain-containing protein [Bacteroidota bacterium]